MTRWAAVLPWYAVASGIYSLCLYVLLLVPMAGGILDGTVGRVLTDLLFAVTVFVALPLGLLLLAMPSGLIWAASRRPPVGLVGNVVWGGCVVLLALPAQSSRTPIPTMVNTCRSW